MNEVLDVGSIVLWTATPTDTGIVLKVNFLESQKDPYYDIYWFVEKNVVYELSDRFLKVLVP